MSCQLVSVVDGDGKVSETSYESLKPPTHDCRQRIRGDLLREFGVDAQRLHEDESKGVVERHWL